MHGSTVDPSDLVARCFYCPRALQHPAGPHAGTHDSAGEIVLEHFIALVRIGIGDLLGLGAGAVTTLVRVGLVLVDDVTALVCISAHGHVVHTNCVAIAVVTMGFVHNDEQGQHLHIATPPDKQGERGQLMWEQTASERILERALIARRSCSLPSSTSTRPRTEPTPM